MKNEAKDINKIHLGVPRRGAGSGCRHSPIRRTTTFGLKQTAGIPHARPTKTIGG